MKSTAIYSAEPAKGWLPWGALAPFLAVLFVAVPVLGFSPALQSLGLENAKGDPIGLLGLYTFLVVAFAATGLIVLAWVRFVERRSLATIGLVRPGGARTLLHGLWIGCATISAVVAGIWMLGGYAADGYGKAFDSPGDLLSIGVLLACFVVQAGVEEILFRGWLLSVVSRKFNVALGVLLTSLVFTFLHYSPHQYWLVILSSFLFSAFTCCWALNAGNIWGVMGWHAGWNWLLAVGFELPVTGLDSEMPALLVRLVPRGSLDLTGGAQGPEGSFVCSLFFLGAIAFLVRRFRRSREVFAPARERLAIFGGQVMNNTMSYRGYTASMTFDTEDKIIVGRVLDVDDIISFHGESVSELETNFHTVVDDYVSACEQLGRGQRPPTRRHAET
jgi:uncharacterized protein